MFYFSQVIACKLSETFVIPPITIFIRFHVGMADEFSSHISDFIVVIFFLVLNYLLVDAFNFVITNPCSVNL